MAATEDGPPPLEDMSELLKQVDTLRELRHKSQPQKKQTTHSQNGNGPVQESQAKQIQPDKQMKTTTQIKQTTNVTQTENKEKSSAAVVKKNDNFGGMKKGFLFGAPSQTKPVQSSSKPDSSNKQSVSSGSKKTLEDIPYVRKNADAKSEFRFSEVQEAMEKTNTKLMENKEWVTDDLLTKLEKNEKLTKRLQDPRFMQAIGEFQKNPTEALKKYGQDADIQEFLQDFCSLMGDHFNKLSDQQDSATERQQQNSQNVETSILTPSSTGSGADMSVHSSTNPNVPTAADEQKMKEILSNPEIRNVLMDPKIQDIIQELRNNPANGHRMLQTASGDLKQKIHTLVQAGILQFERT
ncbi:hypothetical protein ACF0H5_007547 [Mactra antiquata]